MKYVKVAMTCDPKATAHAQSPAGQVSGARSTMVNLVNAYCCLCAGPTPEHPVYYQRSTNSRSDNVQTRRTNGISCIEQSDDVTP